MWYDICMPKLNKKVYRVTVFFVGIIATIAYRIIIILNHYSAAWVEIAWYIGTLGFIWYFAHRWRVENRRDLLIEEMELAKKIEEKRELTSKERESIVYILRGLKTSLAKWNYIAIFIFSIIALIYAVYTDIAALF